MINWARTFFVVQEVVAHWTVPRGGPFWLILEDSFSRLISQVYGEGQMAIKCGSLDWEDCWRRDSTSEGGGIFKRYFLSLRLLPLFSNGFLQGLNAPSTPCYSFSADFPSFINHSSHTHLSFFQRSRLGVRLIVMQMAKGPMCVSHTGIGAIQLRRGVQFSKGGIWFIFQWFSAFLLYSRPSKMAL